MEHLFTSAGTEIVALITLKTKTQLFLISCDTDTLSRHKHILVFSCTIVLWDEICKRSVAYACQNVISCASMENVVEYSVARAVTFWGGGL